MAVYGGRLGALGAALLQALALEQTPVLIPTFEQVAPVDLHGLFERRADPLLAPETPAPGWTVETVLPGSTGPGDLQGTAHSDFGVDPEGARAGTAGRRLDHRPRARHAAAARSRGGRYHDRPARHLDQSAPREVRRMAAAICARRSTRTSSCCGSTPARFIWRPFIRSLFG